MDGRRLIAQPLTWIARLRARPPTSAARRARVDYVQHEADRGTPQPARRRMPSWLEHVARRWWLAILRIHVPRGVGLAATLLVILGGLIYGAIKGDHVPAIVAGLKDLRDQAANAAGFRIVSLALSGNQHVTREEVLAMSGVT